MKDVIDNSEVDQHLAVLITNSGAVRAVVEAVQGTLGPKGLDCMLVDKFGTVMVTNDGVSILRTMDVNHPAARILISAAEFQEEQVGDGTTTMTLIAGTLINEGVDRVIKGVPVVKIIEGIKTGIDNALTLLEKTKVHLDNLENNILDQIALIAGRNHRELAGLVVKAARMVGSGELQCMGFKLADQIIALEGSENLLIQGTIVDKEPLNQDMPRKLNQAKIIIFDDALEPQKIENEALGTEAGLTRMLQSQTELEKNIIKLAELGVNAIFTDRLISEQVEDLLTDLGIIAVQMVSRAEWQRLSRFTGARPIKRGTLNRPAADLQKYLGKAAEVGVDLKFRQIRVMGYPEQSFVTLVVGAATQEVVSERERIAKDAAAAVQAAWCGGVVPGGGSIELGLARKLMELQPRGMVNYGYHCVIEALKRPMTQICINAGFNPFEKIEEVLAQDEINDTYAYGVNCDDGAIANMTLGGIWDPYDVKYHAIKTAGEVSEAILRINTMIKMKEDQN